MSFLLSFSWDLCCGTFLINARVFRFYHHCPSFTTASLLVSNTPSYGSRFFSSWEERWSGRIAFPFPHLPGFHCYNPGQKSLGQYCNIHIFLSFLGSLLKQCILFEIFLQFSLPPPYTKLKLGKNSGYTRPTLFVGWGEGLYLCELENAPEMQKCPKTFVHDCLIKRWEEKRQFWGVFKPVKVFFRDPDERS